MRQLALRGGPYSESEKSALFDYCCIDVEMTEQLFQAMATHNDYPRALLRGALSTALADMENHGSQGDLAIIRRLQKHWPAIKAELIREVE
jgi:DNA polymerase-1